MAGWLGLCGLVLAGPGVRGVLVTDGVTGQSAAAHGWVEQKMYACPMEKGTGAGVQSAA